MRECCRQDQAEAVQGSAKNYLRLRELYPTYGKKPSIFSNTYWSFEAMPPRGPLEGGLPPRGQTVLLVANLKGMAGNELVRRDNSDNLRGGMTREGTCHLVRTPKSTDEKSKGGPRSVR